MLFSAHCHICRDRGWLHLFQLGPFKHQCFRPAHSHEKPPSILFNTRTLPR